LKCKRNTLKDKDKLLKRLNIIEGQVKGLQAMIETEKSCTDVLMQLTATRAALSKVGDLFLKEYTNCFIMKANDSKIAFSKEVLEEFIINIQKYSK
jgi:CsoR family transcriptional regulator, copper-sensing transcriptional repressor